MPYKALSPLLGLRRREESYPGIDPAFSGLTATTTWQPATSPFISRAPRDYETAIAESPVKHAMINAPFLKLRRRTESLLDTITGGTLPAEVLENERKQKEMERQLKCRGCRVVFGSEEGLNGHLRLFPAHVNPPEYKRKPRKKKGSRSRRSHSTSDVASSAASITSSRRSTTPKPATVPTSRHGRSATVSIPPSTSHLPSLYPEVTAPATFQEAVEAVEERKYYQVRPSPPRDLPDIPIVHTEWRVVNPDQSTPTETPVAVPTLPPLSFGSFQQITPVGAREQALARPLPRKADTVTPLINHEERNVRAGEYAAIRDLARRQEEHIRRSQPEQIVVPLPTGIGGVVKAVIATSATGPSGKAVVPSSPRDIETPVFVSRTSERQTKGVLKIQPVTSAEELSKAKREEVVQPVVTGITSFSTSSPVNGDDDKENNNTEVKVPNSASTLRRLLPRRSTNPFLDEAFMHSYSSSSASTAKTPPLSPSSPFARYSPGNPFARMMQDSDLEDNGDDFADAPSTPSIDLGEAYQLSSSSSSKNNNTNPFFADVSPADKGEEGEENLDTSNEISPKMAISRGVRFEARAAMTAEDNPCCPSCHRAFLDLSSVLAHLDRSNCRLEEPGSPAVLQAIIY